MSRLIAGVAVALVVAACAVPVPTPAPVAPTTPAPAPIETPVAWRAPGTGAASPIRVSCWDVPAFDCFALFWRATSHNVNDHHIASMAAAPVDPALAPRPTASPGSLPRAVYAVRVVLEGVNVQITGVYERSAEDDLFKPVSAPAVQPPEIADTFVTFDCGPYVNAQETCVFQAFLGLLFSQDRTIQPTAISIVFDDSHGSCSARYLGCDYVTFTLGDGQAPVVVPVSPKERGGGS